MARVPYLTESELAEPDRALLYPGTRIVPQVSRAESLEGKRPANLYCALANSPEALRHWSVFGRWLPRGCEVPPRLRELAILQVGYLTATAYQWSHHIKGAREAGLSDQDIRGLIAANSSQAHELGALERLVLQAAREITLDGRMSGQTWDQLLTHLSQPRLVDLTLIISHCNAVARVLGTLCIDVEPEFQPFLDEFPLPGRP
jgi:alkylhydroperoxidase family enzyme